MNFANDLIPARQSLLSRLSDWNEDYETTLMAVAIERVKKKVDARQYLVFDLYVFKKWPVARVARALSIDPGKVYLVKYKIRHLIKQELTLLRTRPASSQ